MFEHSVKVPRHYKIAANIFKKVATEGGSVKNLLYDDKLKHFRTNVLYALITETIKHANDIDKIFENSGILAKEQRLDPWLAKVLTVELLFGKKSLPGKSKPELTILSYKEQFENLRSENPVEVKSKVVSRPRYVRINTNLLTTSDAIRAFQDEGYKFIRCTSGSYDDYLKQIQSLSEYDFTQDYHVKTMFVFSPGTKFHDHDLYLENQIILQDKATALAVHLLSPPPGSTVLDMCAAPGMKTTQVAAFLRNQGKVYAVERNEQRYETLQQLVQSSSSKCVETIHRDVLEIRKGELDDVEYIILDPSCSGSGMEFSLHNYIEDTRLAKLTSLQEKFLKHAMNAFPKARRIVYSTCSLFPEENERVVTNVVKTSRAKWRVQDVKELLKGQWNNFGSGMYGSMGTRCMYARPDSDLTTGFFLAVLDKDRKVHADWKESLADDNEKTNKPFPDGEVNVEGTMTEAEVIVKKKKIKDKGKSENESEIEIQRVVTEVEPNLTEDIETKKKKKHKRSKSLTDDVDGGEIEENALRDVNLEKKKKTRKRESEIEGLTGNQQNVDTTATIEDNIEIKYKKKHKKSKSSEHVHEEEQSLHAEKLQNNVVAEISLIESEDEKEDNVEAKNKKKRKKNKQSENVNSDKGENVEQNLDTEELQDDIEEVPLKKKKKSKSEELIPVDIIDLTEDTVVEQKKKKKRKHQTNDKE